VLSRLQAMHCGALYSSKSNTPLLSREKIHGNILCQKITLKFERKKVVPDEKL